MIKFAEENDNSNYSDIDEGLQKLLDILYSEEDHEDDENIITNLSELIDLVYHKLFIDNKNKIQITITKNSNNSLNLNVDQCK